jgi:hypothetical protein
MDGEKSRGKKNNNKLSNPYAMDHSKRSIELIRFPFQLGRRSIDIDFITIIFSSPWRTSFYMKRSKKALDAHTHTHSNKLRRSCCCGQWFSIRSDKRSVCRILQ